MTLQGVRVHYEIGGHGERKVVLLHGWGCSEKLMAGISDALAPDMTVLRVDFPAHGESGFPPQPWGVPDFCREPAGTADEARLPAVQRDCAFFRRTRDD